MVRAIIALCLVLSACVNIAGAAEMEIPCLKDGCEGWRVYIDKGFSSEPDVFVALNETGHTAFNVGVTVYYYDVFGEFLGRAEFEHKGPIRQYLKYNTKVGPKVDRAECIVTWSKDPK